MHFNHTTACIQEFQGDISILKCVEYVVNKTFCIQDLSLKSPMAGRIGLISTILESIGIMFFKVIEFIVSKAEKSDNK